MAGDNVFTMNCVSILLYLRVHEDVDERVPADGALGEEERDDARLRPHPAPQDLVERDDRVRRPTD